MSKNSPVKFSVITITYNAESTVECTLQSVCSQTYPHIEYIIIDGKSTDRTLELVEKYESRITTVVSERDKGLYDAMNKGIDRATGDYLCFLNAGDTFHSETALSDLVATLPEGALPDVVYGETALVDAGRNFLRMRRLSAPEHLTWRSFQKGMLVCHQAFFARRELAEHYDTAYRFSADFDWCIRIMKRAHQMHNTHLTLIDYLSEGITTKNRNASLKERFRIMCRYYGTVPTIINHIWFVIRAIFKK